MGRFYPQDIGNDIGQPDFIDLIRQFIHDQEYLNSASDTRHDHLPTFHDRITHYPSAVATFHALSDISGTGGMRRERIRAVKSWRRGPPRYDTVFVNTGPSADNINGLDIARTRLFFSFSHNDIKYPCALVDWFSRVGDLPHDTTGMWVVTPTIMDDDTKFTTIIHLDTIVRAAHLLPVFGREHILRTLTHSDTLNKFSRFYVNKYADHHSFEIAS